MLDIRFKPKMRTVISMPDTLGFRLRHKTNDPNLQKEKADGGGDVAWSTLEYLYTEKSRDWFWAVGIVAAALIIASLILGNALFAGLILVSAAAIFLHAIRKPAHIRCEAGKRGLTIENTLYAWKDIESFWISDEQEGTVPILHLKTKKPFSPYLALPLRRDDKEKLRGLIGRHVAEEKFDEPLSHRLAEMVGL